ncbi:MAG: YggS family pyridoxal phosphate enzyme [Planctomycetia bacterium]|nr:YggS family pyridoxal phosphate enzyme [Planctomycetia bacterium]
MRGRQDRLAANLAAVRERIAAACRQAGRSPEGVTLVAVTKYLSADLTRLVLEAGVTELAESRPQTLWTKAEALATGRPAARWHLVGHLQRNKVHRTLPLLAMLHTLDSPRLLEAIEAESERDASGDRPPCEVLVEVGLMGMAGHPDAEASDARRDFARLRAVRDELAPTLPDPAALAELSMGMSGDFEAAILEGATLVRIGSALFEGLF